MAANRFTNAVLDKLKFCPLFANFSFKYYA
jgi:hypothetical protein